MPVRVVENWSAASEVSGQDGSSEHGLPPPFTLLSPGKAFAGTQNVSSLQKDEAWRVNVQIQGCDLEHGYLCGTMEALNVPLADTPVMTFWEGEIVDTKNYTFYTGKWEATPEDDVRHWSRFPSFSPLQSQVEIDGGKSLDLSNYPHLFMVSSVSLQAMKHGHGHGHGHGTRRHGHGDTAIFEKIGHGDGRNSILLMSELIVALLLLASITCVFHAATDLSMASTMIQIAARFRGWSLSLQTKDGQGLVFHLMSYNKKESYKGFTENEDLRQSILCE